ncbi:Ribosome maturation factor rimM [Candidatus Moranella endobia PCVAL]|uniref:Ribosome maturation factor RimM n=1 Tax=Moranella endobia (strain PCIT) TaxID=903503 RepID=F7XXX7_MOREP|nr:ribosome maturation factor RimM [Candidatus Moranella endobia]AEI74953.1 16S rRNA-processing protein RimM [Candidatus Moranella endobia PCIT]AGJ61201.1 Ribosome maturation factor rimM [Candidatus Moranella endobia PCVAL]
MNKKNCITEPVEPVVVGKMGSSYSIRGWLRLCSSTEETEKIFDYQPWFIKIAGEWQMILLENWKRHYQDLIIKVRDVENREAARLLTNCEICVDAAQWPKLDNGKYYWKDLLRCQVLTVGGYKLGDVIDLIETGANDVLVVTANLKDAFGLRERLIPFIVGPVIQNVDLASKLIEANWDPRV